ncbi:MAG: VapE domain-containing protein [Oscillospiraceae bacterium]
MRPGCKFDTMLVLKRSPGRRQDTLISQPWPESGSPDSLNLGDTKDKTAAEKLQGYWILEIGELARASQKAEVETAAFLPLPAERHLPGGVRQTGHAASAPVRVLSAPLNAESGYLRDTTGNRRFWPVKTPGGGKKQSWNLTHEEILQIWAEVLVYVRARREAAIWLPKWTTLAKERAAGSAWSPMSARGWCGSTWTPCCRNAGWRWTSLNAAISWVAPISAACRRRVR